jgi:uncharacterized protein YdcH (DUF465 family)
MENHDQEMIQKAMLSLNNPRLTRLYEEHKKLNEEVARLQNRPFLTSPEENMLARLKRKKLRGMEEMITIARSAAF